MLYILEHEVLSALTALQIWQKAVMGKLQKDTLPAWAAPPSGIVVDANARRITVDVLSQMEYLPGQDGRETLILPGVITVNDELMQLIVELNHKKDAFKAKCRALIDQSGDRDAVRKLLNSNDFTHLNINHAYRHIPVVDVCPKKVSFTWATTRSLTRISRNEAIRRLKDRDHFDDGIDRQIEAAQSLPENEPLVVVQHLKSQAKANVTWFRTDTGLTRRLINCPTPLIIPLDPDKGFPNCVPPGETQTRKPRRDVRIEPFAFLPAIRCYRYLPEYR